MGHVRGTSLALRSWAEESGDRNQRRRFVNAPPPCAPPARSSRRRCRSRDNQAEARARLFLSYWNRCGGRCDSRGRQSSRNCAAQHGSVPTSMAAAILACEGCVGHVRGTSLALRSWAEESGDRNQRRRFVNAPPPCAPPARSSRRRCRSRDNQAEARARLFLSCWNRCGGRCDSRGSQSSRNCAAQHGSVPTSMAAAILACEGCVGHVRGTSLALCLNLQRKHLDISVCDCELRCIKAEVGDSFESRRRLY